MSQRERQKGEKRMSRYRSKERRAAKRIFLRALAVAVAESKASSSDKVRGKFAVVKRRP